MELTRIYLTQWLIDKKGFQTYLEVGLADKADFISINAKRKIIVDSMFKPTSWEQFKYTLRNRYNFNASYYKMEVDVFFEEAITKALGGGEIDICRINCKGEYMSVVAIVENVLEYLSEKGVIIILDCDLPDMGESDTKLSWHKHDYNNSAGDLWKAIMHLRSTREDINVFVLDRDYGLGIITKGKPEKPLLFSPYQISQMTSAEFRLNKIRWLNLKPGDYIYNYFNL